MVLPAWGNGSCEKSVICFLFFFKKMSWTDVCFCFLELALKSPQLVLLFSFIVALIGGPRTVRARSRLTPVAPLYIVTQSRMQSLFRCPRYLRCWPMLPPKNPFYNCTIETSSIIYCRIVCRLWVVLSFTNPLWRLWKHDLNPQSKIMCK